MTQTLTRVKLGRSGLSVSPVCYGSWQASPRFWGDQPEDVLGQAMRHAFEVGVNFYDTADAYGDGLSERILGKALRGLPRDRIVVATKLFWHFFPDGRRFGDLSREYVLEACEASLQRLGMDYIDLYQCHSWDPLAHPAEIVESLEKLLKQGKVRAYGHSNWTVEQMRTGHAFGRFSTTQPPYSLLKREIESDLLPYCLATDTGTLVYSSLHLGLLTGKFAGTETFTDLRKNNPDFQGERFKTLCDRVKQVGQIGQKYGLTTTQVVLAVTLMNPGITSAIVGIKTPEQIEEAAGAMGKTVSREDATQVRSLLSVPK